MVAEQRAVLRRAVGSSTTPIHAVPEDTIVTVPAGGDEIRLRGIPVIGARGIGGVSPHTQPERETIRRSEHAQRTGRAA